MRTFMVIAAAASIASCSRPVSPPGSSLAEVTQGRIAGPPQSCISTNPSENLRVIDPQTIAYGVGRTVYINRLAGPCPGMDEMNTIIVEAATGGQYCQGDRIRGREPQSIIAGPSCNLNEWIAYRQP